MRAVEISLVMPDPQGFRNPSVVYDGDGCLLYFPAKSGMYPDFNCLSIEDGDQTPESYSL